MWPLTYHYLPPCICSEQPKPKKDKGKKRYSKSPGRISAFHAQELGGPQYYFKVCLLTSDLIEAEAGFTTQTSIAGGDRGSAQELDG